MERLITVMVFCSVLLFFSEKLILDFILYGIMILESLLAGFKMARKKINWSN